MVIKVVSLGCKGNFSKYHSSAWVLVEMVSRGIDCIKCWVGNSELCGMVLSYGTVLLWGSWDCVVVFLVKVPGKVYYGSMKYV